MRNIIFTLILMTFSVCIFAQSDFDQKISDNVVKLKKAKTTSEFDILYDNFSALTQSDTPNRWKAYYNAGLAKYQKAEFILKSQNSQNSQNLEESNAIAYKYVMGAFTTQQTNAEIQNLLKLIEIQRKKIINSNVITKR